jgi:hypothetical protein
MAKKDKRRAKGAAKAKRREQRKRREAALRAGRDPVQGAWRLPLVGCFVNQAWRERHMASLIVFRDLGRGKLVVASALVDLGCLGVKDAWLRTDMEFMEYESALRRLRSLDDPGVPCEPELAVGILVAGKSYAAELGFEPHREWERVLQVLGPPSEDATLSEIPCGEGGKPLYIAGPDDNVPAVIGMLERRLGPDGFHFIAPAGSFEDEPQGVAAVGHLLDDLAATCAEDQESLLLRCGKLKRGLVLWSLADELVDRLRAYGRDMPVAQGEERDPDEIIDRFIGSYRFEDGSSVHESFVARFPQLRDEDRRIILGWKDTVEGIFEIVRHTGDHLELVNLVDELPYIVRSNQGRAGLKQAPKKGFLIGRVCPLGDEWLLSGEHRVFRPPMEDEMLAMAAGLSMKVPRLFFRNPAHLERAWDQQAKMHKDFVAHFGSDEVLLRGSELQAAMDGFLISQRERARARAEREGAPLPAAMLDAAPTRFSVPPDLLREPDVAILDHPRWGQGIFVGYGALRAAFQDPKGALQRRGVIEVREYLMDKEAVPLPLILLGDRYAEAACMLFATILRRPDFDWRRDGEALLREYKGEHYDKLLPYVVPLPGRYTAAMQRSKTRREG